MEKMKMMKISIKDYVQQEKEKLRQSCPKAPYLVIIDPSPQDIGNKLYIDGKVKDFHEMGWGVEVRRVTSLEEYEQAMREAQLQATAIIVQTPSMFPIDINIYHHLDADAQGKNSKVLPATVRGIVDYLDANDFRFDGNHAVVLGRGRVGKPLADELLRRNMTVSICHSHTTRYDRVALLRNADLVVSAIGKPRSLLREELLSTAIVVDVGINLLGNKIVGDFVEDETKCSTGWSTPVPGGVGLLTRLAFMKNCVELANRY